MNWLMSETFLTYFGGSVVLVMGACWYIMQKEKRIIQKEIELIKKVKVYDETQLRNLEKLLSQYQAERTFFLYKAKGKNLQPIIASIQSEINIYSNQLYFCPPSVEPIFEKQIKKHRSIFQRGKLRILTDKFQYKTDFKPRQTPPITQLDSSSILGQIKLFLQIGREIFYQFRKNFWYFEQRSLEFFKIKKDQKRSYDKHRSPFYKGVWAGILNVNFNLLKDSYYVLKINIQGSKAYFDVVADNKLALINLSEKAIRILTIGQILCIPYLLFGTYQIGKRIKQSVRRIWFNLTTFDRKILNPSNISDDKLCQICYIKCRNVLFYGCKHVIVCDDCYQHLGKDTCIICNHVLQKAQPMYMVSK